MVTRRWTVCYRRYDDARFNVWTASPRSIVGTNVSIDRRKSRLVATRGNDVGNNAATKLGRTLLDRWFRAFNIAHRRSKIFNLSSITYPCQDVIIRKKIIEGFIQNRRFILNNKYNFYVYDQFLTIIIFYTSNPFILRDSVCLKFGY